MTSGARRDVETKTTLYWVIISLFYTAAAIIVRGDEVTPLAGSSRHFPRLRGYADGAGELARLLDVGSCINEWDRNISYVPPLDGTVALPGHTRCLDRYGMNFVLFDFQLVNLKAVDSLNGFFTVELQLVLYWKDFIEKSGAGSFVDPNNKNCSFLCDTSSPSSLCCDEIWVPPLRIPGCQLNEVQSIMDHPYLYSFQNESITNMTGCEQNEFSCIWRRLWYLNIDAQCAVEMNFHDFPFDTQNLNLDILNPYSSRTWFQLTQGFLKQNVDDRISGVNLSPDKKISGWYIRDLLVSSSCDSGVQTWQNTFITQDDLLKELSLKDQYTSQKEKITQALVGLQCANIKNLNMGDDIANPANWDSFNTTTNTYSQRVQDTLQAYHKCAQNFGVDYNLTLTKEPSIPLQHLAHTNFSISEGNLNRSFGLFNLFKERPTKVSFTCAIQAIANLTTPGIRITISIKRVRTYYTVKLILPTISCVAFAFSAFGMQPKEIVGRLTVVVPSAIALTALQSLIVASDIPVVAYLAPTTYIFVLSYAIQLLIAFESIYVYWVDTCQQRQHRDVPQSATNMQTNSLIQFHRLPKPQQEVELSSSNQNQENSTQEESSYLASKAGDLLLRWHQSLVTHVPKRKRVISCSDTRRKQRRVLILELNGVLLKTIEMQHGDVCLDWAKHMLLIEKNTSVWHLIHKDAFTFLDFYMQWFEVWIWSASRLQRTRCILELCSPQHHQKFKVVAGQVACQKTDLLIGYQFVYQKKLDVAWRIFHDLDGDNTLIFDDTLYSLMWNMPKTYLIFPKMWNQSTEELQRFLETTITTWLLGWIYAKNR